MGPRKIWGTTFPFGCIDTVWEFVRKLQITTVQLTSTVFCHKMGRQIRVSSCTLGCA